MKETPVSAAFLETGHKSQTLLQFKGQILTISEQQYYSRLRAKKIHCPAGGAVSVY